MNKTETMARLEELGSEQTRKTYRRHGVACECFGVSYGELGKLIKTIGVDHELAEELWATANHDARVLATMIADPAQMKTSSLDAWVQVVGDQLMLDAVASLAIKSKHAERCMTKWMKSKNEWIAATGWHILAGGCCGRPGRTASAIAEKPEEFFESQLQHIETHIHCSPNRVRHSMNAALIAVGIRGGGLKKKALAAAKRIGKVEVDHGETACKTPDAADYIRKTIEHHKKKKNKIVSKKKRSTGKTAVV